MRETTLSEKINKISNKKNVKVRKFISSFFSSVYTKLNIEFEGAAFVLSLSSQTLNNFFNFLALSHDNDKVKRYVLTLTGFMTNSAGDLIVLNIARFSSISSSFQCDGVPAWFPRVS